MTYTVLYYSPPKIHKVIIDNYYTTSYELSSQQEQIHKKTNRKDQINKNNKGVTTPEKSESRGSKYKDNNNRREMEHSECAYRPHELAAPRPRPRTTPIHPRSRSRSTEDDGPRGTPANDP
jgi:hypothetical protein